jgi:hypothetical protein
MSGSSAVYFYLVPQGTLATDIISDRANARFKHRLPSGKDVLRFGFNHTPKKNGSFVSFGSNSNCCDVLLPRDFPQMQCHFFTNRQSGELLLRDDTANEDTFLSVPGGAKFYLPDTQPRQRVLLTSEGDIVIKMQLAQFKLLWGTAREGLESAKAKYMPSNASQNLPTAIKQKENRYVRSDANIVHHHIKKLGRGVSAKVFLTTDLTTGDHLAVKEFYMPEDGDEERLKMGVRKEVDLISQLSHVRSLC